MRDPFKFCVTTFVFCIASAAQADFTNFTSTNCSSYLGTRTLCIDNSNLSKYSSLASDQVHRKLTIDANFMSKQCIGGCTGVLVNGITLDMTGASGSVIRIDGVGNVKVQDSTLVGGEIGIFVTGGSHDIDLINNQIKDQQDIDTSDTDLTGRGMRISSSTSSSNILFKDNSIFNTESDGIIIAQNDTLGVSHTNIHIIHNTIEQVAKNRVFWPGHYHGIYAQAGSITISGNIISQVADGNGISIRNSGVIDNNTVLHTGKAGIAYFADHRRLTNQLTINNNTVYFTGENPDACCVGQPAIRLLPVPSSSEYYVGPSSPKNDSSWYVQNFTIVGNVVSGTGQIQNQDPTRFNVILN